MNSNDMVDISVEVEALNLDGIKQNLLDYVEKEAKIDINDSVEKADKSAQDASASAVEAATSAELASDSARQASESLGYYYTKSETDNLLNAKQNILTFDNVPTSASTNPVTSGGVYTALSGKADKAATLAGYGITDGANTALSNLSANGQMIVGSQNGTISNCVLEIPHNIQCSIASNVVTLLSGSILTNTGSSYATTILSADQTYTVDNSLADGNYLLCSNGAAIQAPLALSVTGSGSSLPADDSTYTYFFNTTDQLIYKYADGAWSATSYCYPFAEITMSSGVASLAKDSNGNEMIFNGACFVGHHIVTFPNIKLLNPNGFNADGTMASKLITLSALYITEMTNQYTVIVITDAGALQRRSVYKVVQDVDPNYTGCQYVVSKNIIIYNKTQVRNQSPLIFFTFNGINVNKFDIVQPVRTATTEMLNNITSTVVHNSGNEDINGAKSFYNVIKSKNSSYTGTYEGYYYQQGGGELIQGLRVGSTWLNYIQYKTDGSIHFSGTVDVPTPANGDNSTKVATTAFVNNYFTAITGYDATKTQTLKNVSGVLTWVDD